MSIGKSDNETEPSSPSSRTFPNGFAVANLGVSILSGPLFMLLLGLSYLAGPDPAGAAGEVRVEAFVLVTLGSIPFTLIFAPITSFPASLVASAVLVLLASDRPLFARASAWLIAGAIVGGPIGLLVLDAFSGMNDASWTIGMWSGVLDGAVCATLLHRLLGIGSAFCG